MFEIKSPIAPFGLSDEEADSPCLTDELMFCLTSIACFLEEKRDEGVANHKPSNVSITYHEIAFLLSWLDQAIRIHHHITNSAK